MEKLLHRGIVCERVQALNPGGLYTVGKGCGLIALGIVLRLIRLCTVRKLGGCVRKRIPVLDICVGYIDVWENKRRLVCARLLLRLV